MDKRVRLQCKECNFVIEFQPKDLREVDFLHCPNCGNTLIGEPFRKFTKEIDCLRDIQQELPGVATLENKETKGFHVSIEMNI